MAKRLSKRFYRTNMKLGTSNEEADYTHVLDIINSCVNMHDMSKNDFLKEMFNGAFKLIPEAEKGSFYELSGEKYIPIFSNGYDLNILQKLEFNREDAFIDYDCSADAKIDAYQIYINRRDDSKFSKKTIEIFKELGTYENFTSLYAPVQVGGINLGLLSLDRFNKIGFSNNSKKVLKFYAQIISDFYAQKIFHLRETKMYDDTVTALVSAIEINDKYTEGHAKRVRQYSLAIANKLNLSKDRVNNIGTAALLHDIGKIGIPATILNKPGKLTEDEYNEIKLHPEYTKKILEKVSGFSSIADIAYCHHENYDGSGYPRGLKGDEIPIEAQIIQVADSYDAMTSDRAYRKALSAQKALEIIKNESGKQFNPKIAEVAISLFSEK